jgi:hypothetical protein
MYNLCVMMRTLAPCSDISLKNFLAPVIMITHPSIPQKRVAIDCAADCGDERERTYDQTPDWNRQHHD